MITAFVGCMNEQVGTTIRGNGKTCSMTGYLLLYKRQNYNIITNYQTDFSEIMGFQQMINTLDDKKEHPNTILGISEMGRLLNSLGTETRKALFVENFVRQIRKLDVSIMYDDQRYMNIHKRLRVHTDTVLIPQKMHLNNEPCYNDLCKKEHIINVYSEIPYKEKRIRAFYASKVGAHYNTKEFIEDELIVPKKVKHGD